MCPSASHRAGRAPRARREHFARRACASSSVSAAGFHVPAREGQTNEGFLGWPEGVWRACRARILVLRAQEHGTIIFRAELRIALGWRSLPPLIKGGTIDVAVAEVL